MKFKHLVPLALLPVALSAGITYTDTTPFDLYDTGLSDIGYADDYWNWDDGTDYVDAYHIAPHNNWFGAPTGNWIWTSVQSASDPAPIGSWTFALTFDLTGYDYENTTIKGKWGSDNDAYMTLLGGSGIAGSGLSGNQFSALKDFEITDGFVQGLNTLLITLENKTLKNGDAGTWSNNPAGLNVQFTGITTTPVPEPSTLLGALTLSSLSLLFLRRRR